MSTIPTAIDDPSYATPGGQIIGFKLAAGPQHLDGDQALAYVRSRHGAGNNDWARGAPAASARGAAAQDGRPGAILQLPSLISKLSASVSTTFPADRVADYVAIGQNMPSSTSSRSSWGRRTTRSSLNGSSTAATTCLLNAKVAALSVQLFGKDSLWYGKPAPANTCS